ncbi:hypothetical protein [Nitrosomonas sp. wSCUT-2]
MIDRPTHFRLARPVSNLHRMREMYQAGLGLEEPGWAAEESPTLNGDQSGLVGKNQFTPLFSARAKWKNAPTVRELIAIVDTYRLFT